MKKSTIAILEEIRKERDRRSALTRRELERAYQALKDSGYDLGLLMDFSADLAGSRQIEYHYELVVEDWKRDKTDRLYLEDGFARRRKEGRDFLFPLLNVRGAFEPVHIASLIAQSFYSPDKSEEPERERLVPYLLRYAELPSPELRRIAIIALGWGYAPSQLQSELNCLCDHLVNDGDALCRAWSASAFMQLSFHQAPAEPIRERSLSAFRQSLGQETDDFVVGVTVDSIKELWGWKFRLSAAAVDRRDHEAIEKARRRALRLMAQL